MDPDQVREALEDLYVRCVARAVMARVKDEEQACGAWVTCAEEISTTLGEIEKSIETLPPPPPSKPKGGLEWL